MVHRVVLSRTGRDKQLGSNIPDAGALPGAWITLSMLDEWCPDLILLDMQMPVMDGWRFMERYRRRPAPRAPVVVCTAAPDPTSRARSVAADGVIAKPFTIDGILRVLECCVSRTPRTATRSQRHTGSSGRVDDTPDDHTRQAA